MARPAAIGLAALSTVLLLLTATTRAANVIWVSPTDGYWDVGSNWDTGAPPSAATDVAVLDVPQDVLVTFRSGNTAIDSIVGRERFALTGGTLDLAGSSLFEKTVTQSGGTWTGAGTSQLQASGNSWTAGSWTGTGTRQLVAGADLTLGGTGNKDLWTGTFDVDAGATVTWSQGTVRMGYGAQLNNAGTFEIASSNYVLDYYKGTDPAFNNTGTVRKTSTGNSTIDVAFDNTATVEVTAGSLYFTRGVTQVANGSLTGGNWLLRGGTIHMGSLDGTVTHVAAGAVVQLDAGSSFAPLSSAGFTNDGTIKGNGGVYYGAVINNAGTVAPGASPGRLDIDGSFTQNAAGVLQIEIGGTTQGVDYDWLNVFGTPGTASLAGTLQLILWNGFVANPGDSFTILTASGGVTGTFDIFDAPAGWEVTYTPNAVIVSLGAVVVPEPRSWLLVLGAAATVLAFARRSRR